MRRTLILALSGTVAGLVGSLALFAPAVLLELVKGVEATGPARVMASTVGVLLLVVALLNLLVCTHRDSPTLRMVLVTNLVLQLALLPVDPLAYATGVFDTLGSWVPNTVLHVVLAGLFAMELVLHPTGRTPAAPVR